MSTQHPSQPLRVLYVDCGLSLGGASVCLAEVLPHFERVHAVIQHALPESVASIYTDWDTVTEVPWNAHTHSALPTEEPKQHHSLVRAIRNNVIEVRRDLLPAVRRAQQLMREHQIQLVHCNNNIGGNLPALLAANRLGIPCIVHERIFEPESRLVRLLGKRATFYVCMSQAIADQIQQWGIPAGRIRVIYDGIALDTLTAPREQSERVSIGTVGRFVEWKGVHVFVEAALAIAESCPQAHFTFVGGSAPEAPGYYERLRKQVEESPVSAQFTFTGERPNGWELMQQMDVFVHTSTYPEPFGRVLTEAMAAGCAVVSTDHGGPREICANGAGMLLPPGDVPALAQALEQLAGNPTTRAELTARGQERVRSTFDIRQTAAELEALYEECMQTGGATMPQPANAEVVHGQP